MARALRMTVTCKHCNQTFVLQATNAPILRSTDNGWEVVVKADGIDFDAHMLTHNEVLT